MLVPVQIFSGWVLTLLFACAIASLFTALGVNSPNRQQTDQINNAQQVCHLVCKTPLAPLCGTLDAC